jgi:replicative DNA helicase
MGGIEPNTIYSIAGISGSGKSSFLNSLETDIYDLNKEVDFVVLSFNFEMLSSRQIGRKLSYKLSKTTSELYAGTNSTLTEKDISTIKRVGEDLKKYPIYFVDVPGTVEQIKNTIYSFMNEPFAKDKWLVVMLDHTLLTRGKEGDREREVLSELQRFWMELKKVGKTTILQLSQLNRNIEASERINNPTLHFPMRNDLFGSESVYQASDYVLIMHRPEILQIKAYGPQAWPTENLIYLHLLKNREGELKIMSFVNNLKYNRIDETEPVIKDGKVSFNF